MMDLNSYCETNIKVDTEENTELVHSSNEIADKSNEINTETDANALCQVNFTSSSMLTLNAAGSLPQPIIHNIVSTVNFNCQLNLSNIASRVRNAEYNPKRFRAIIMRIFDPRTTGMIFSSGKMVCTGARSERSSCLACRKYGRILQKLGYKIIFSDFKVQNIVCTIDVKFPICLDKLSLVHSQFSSYDPDFFPALIYRMVKPRTVLLIFVSGKIIIIGAKNYEEILETIGHILPVLQSFRKP